MNKIKPLLVLHTDDSSKQVFNSEAVSAAILPSTQTANEHNQDINLLYGMHVSRSSEQSLNMVEQNTDSNCKLVSNSTYHMLQLPPPSKKENLRLTRKGLMIIILHREQCNTVSEEE